MTANVIQIADPFRPTLGRIINPVDEPMTVREWMVDNDFDPDCAPTICLFNGDPLLRAEWETTTIQDDDVVQLIRLPQGGGQGSNPMRVVLMVAVMVAAYYTGGAAAAAYGSAAGYAAQAAVIIVGTMMVNAMIPPPSAKPQEDSSTFNASPTYSLIARANRNRINSPIPVLYGRHVIYPDYAAQPYTEYNNNDQYLFALFCLGHGEYDVEAIRIDDTAAADKSGGSLAPTGNFEGFEYELIDDGSAPSLFPSIVNNSIEVTGQELDYQPGGSSVIIGPFVASPAGSTVNYIGVDIVLPRGLGYYNDDGTKSSRSLTVLFEARQIDDAGAPIGSFFALGTETITASSFSPIRRSFRYAVTSARYEVRASRTTVKESSDRYAGSVFWTAMRGYQPETKIYPGKTIMAVRIKASNQLNGDASRRFNVIMTRKLKSWTSGAGWSSLAQPTRSPAWALADMLKASYGGELTDSFIDLATLESLDATWSSRGDYFDGVFDSETGLWDAVTQVARVGRAMPILQAGIVSFVRDAAQSAVTAVYTLRNIVRGTFSLQYLMPSVDNADSVVVTYVDETTWRPADVTAALPSSSAAKPAKVRLFGVTSRDQAWREGMYMAASNYYRRRLCKFRTELEGYIPTPGDLILISHDMPAWGQSGEIVSHSYDAGADVTTLVTNEPLTYTTGQNHFIALRRRDGSMSGPWQVTQGADAYTVTIAGALDFTPYTGSSEERTHYAFGYGETYGLKAKVIEVRPRGATQVEITAVGEADAVHTAENGQTPAPPSPSQLPGQVTAPVVTGLDVSQTGTRRRPVLIVSWDASPYADHYYVEFSNDGVNWDRVGEPSAAPFRFYADPGTGYVRVAAVGIVRGPWAQWTGQVAGDTTPPNDVVNFNWSIWQYNINLTWDAVTNVDFEEYEIRMGGTSWADAAFLATTKATNWTYQNLPAGSTTFRIKAIDENGNESVNEATTVATIAAPSAPSVVAEVIDNNVLLRWTESNGTLPIDFYEIRRGASWDTAEVVGTKAGLFTVLFETQSASYTYWVAAIDRAGNYGQPASVTTTVNQPSDYVLNANYLATWNGAMHNAAPQDFRMFYKAFETGEFADWAVPAGDALTQDADTDIGAYAGLVVSTQTAPASSGTTGTVHATIDNNLAIDTFSGQTVVVRVRAKTPATGAAAAFAVAYSTNGSGDSGWQSFTPTSQWEWYEFEYAVPAGTTGPDYIGIWGDTAGGGNGVLINAVRVHVKGSVPDKVVAPLDRIETYDGHFSSRSWTTPQAQIDAGYPILIEPTKTAAVLEELIDYGTVLNSSLITVEYDTAKIGNNTITTTISTRRNPTDAWSDIVGTRVFATDFQYVKVKIEIAGTDTETITFNDVNIRLDSKLINDAGAGTANASDTSGTTVNFNVAFVDVESITVTPEGTTPIIPVIDFVDAPYPTSFAVYLFDETGARVSANFRWAARGY